MHAVHDNLENLGLDVLEVVNLRVMFDPQQPAEGSSRRRSRRSRSVGSGASYATSG